LLTKKYPAFMEREVSLSFLKYLAIEIYPQPVASCLAFTPYYSKIRFIIILPSELIKVFFSSGFPAKIVYATCSTHNTLHILLELVTLTDLGQGKCKSKFAPVL
jgi:hypothetical protein